MILPAVHKIFVTALRGVLDLVDVREALLEDASTLEATQSMLASGAKKEFVLQDQELLVRHGHKVIEDMVGFYRAD